MNEKFIFHWDRIPFVLYFLFFILCEIPWLYAFFPGTITYDSGGQILMCLCDMYNDNHPILSSLLFFNAFKIGRVLFHSDNMGIFLYVLMQALYQCFALAYCIELFKRKKAKNIVYLITIFFYCVVPLYMNMGIVMQKDNGYYISSLLCFVTSQLCFLPEIAPSKKWDRIFWIFSLIGMCIFRKEGKVYVLIILVLIFIFTKSHKQNRKLLCYGMISFLIFFAINKTVINRLNIVEKGSVRETMSLPILISATYLRDFYPEMTPQEVESITELFEVENISEITNRINYEIVDELKIRVHYNLSKYQLSQYIKYFIRDFFRHPECYFKVTLLHSDGYFNPFKEKYEDIDFGLYLFGEESRSDKYMDIFYTQSPQVRNNLRKWVHFWDDNVILGIFFNPGFYNMLLLSEILVILCKRRFKIFVWYVPSLLLLIMLIFTPLNGSIRYSLPIMTSMPVYLELLFTKREEKVPFLHDIHR